MTEAADDEITVHSPLDQLDRHALATLIVSTHGQVNRAHPTLPDFTNHPISPDAPVCAGSSFVSYLRQRETLSHGFNRGPRTEIPGAYVRGEECFEFPP